MLACTGSALGTLLTTFAATGAVFSWLGWPLVGEPLMACQIASISAVPSVSLPLTGDGLRRSTDVGLNPAFFGARWAFALGCDAPLLDGTDGAEAGAAALPPPLPRPLPPRGWLPLLRPRRAPAATPAEACWVVPLSPAAPALAWSARSACPAPPPGRCAVLGEESGALLLRISAGAGRTPNRAAPPVGRAPLSVSSPPLPLVGARPRVSSPTRRSASRGFLRWRMRYP